MSGGGNGVGRFYRSRLFWLGVPGLVFLLWVWWDSGGYESAAAWERPSKVNVVRVSNGCLEWERTTSEEGATLWVAVADTFRVGRSEGKEGLLSWVLTGSRRERHFDFPAAFGRSESSISDAFAPGVVRLRNLRVALWVMVLAYGVMWLGAVWWWQRRKKKRLVMDLTEWEVAS